MSDSPLKDFDIATVKAPAVIILRARGSINAERLHNLHQHFEKADLPSGVKVIVLHDLDVMAVEVTT